MSECVVYWLHDAYCTHVQRHGYVGISTNFWRRLEQHQKNKRFPKFDWSIVLIGTRVECLAIERQLRPKPGIGWNQSVGGKPVLNFTAEVRAKMSKPKRTKAQIIADRALVLDPKNKSPEWCAKIAKSLLGHIRSEASKAKQRASAKGKPKSLEWRKWMSEEAKRRGGFNPKPWIQDHSKRSKGEL